MNNKRLASELVKIAKQLVSQDIANTEGKYENFTGKIDFKGNKADVKNATFELKGGMIDWKKGTWNNGTWKNGTWNKGTWLNGTWKKGYWFDGNWEDGAWKNGIWNKGTWFDGTWLDGTWKNGTWKYGIWFNGTWENGTWKNGIWKNGTWKKGIWLDKKKLAPNAVLYGVFDNNSNSVWGVGVTPKDAVRDAAKEIELTEENLVDNSDSRFRNSQGEYFAVDEIDLETAKKYGWK